MLQYPQKIPIYKMLRRMAWRNVKNLNQILHFWNLWVKGFQAVYRLSKSADILEEALSWWAGGNNNNNNMSLLLYLVMKSASW